MTNSTIQNYTRKIADANPTQIIAIVYEIAECYLDEAIEAFNGGNIDLFVSSINKSTRCINDLINALDLQYEISNSLLSIYLFMNKELALAAVKRNVDTVERIKVMVTKLKKSFEELAAKDTSGAVMGNAQEVYAGLTYGKNSLNENTSLESNRGYKA